MNKIEIQNLFKNMNDEQAADLILSKACKQIGEGDTDIIKVLERCTINLDVVKELGELSPVKLFEIHKEIIKKLEFISDGDGYLEIEKSEECSCDECMYLKSNKEDINE